MKNLQWREQIGGVFIAETANFCLRVHKTADRQYVRFLVFKRHIGGVDELIGSGTYCAVREAMIAAERMADRLRPMVKLDNFGIIARHSEEVWQVTGSIH
jgi:hypothetical protein